MAASKSDVATVYRFVETKGKLIDVGQPELHVKFFEIREKVFGTDDTELRLYVGFVSVINDGKIIPVQLRIVHEIWKTMPDGKSKIYQRMVADENLDGQVESGGADIQLHGEDSEVLEYEVIPFPQAEAQAILDQAIKLLITRFTLGGIES